MRLKALCFSFYLEGFKLEGKNRKKPKKKKKKKN